MKPASAKVLSRVTAKESYAVLVTQGETELVRRALRYYIKHEQDALSTAACARDPVHHADVKKQIEPRIRVAGDLIERLLFDPMNTGQPNGRYKPGIRKEAVVARCEAVKFGEYNPLRCCRSAGHEGEHNFVVFGEYTSEKGKVS